MAKGLKPQLRHVSLTAISGYHPAVVDLATSLAERTYSERLDVLSDSAVQALVQLHPIHVRRAVNDEYLIIAGFRSYQLVTSRPALFTTVPALVYPSLSDQMAIDLASVDLIGSPAMHSLGSKSVEQMGLIGELIGEEAVNQIAPGLGSVRARRRFERFG